MRPTAYYDMVSEFISVGDTDYKKDLIYLHGEKRMDSF
jgi:hypothetical protein